MLFTEQTTVYICRGKHIVLRPFYRSHLKANKISKTEGKRVEHTYISESVLMLFTENHQNSSMLVQTTACQSWRSF